MSKTAKNKKKFQIKKSQEIVFKQPSLFRKIVSFITAYSMLFLNVTPAFATNITGVEGNNGVYNIEAAKISGDTGFRQYTDFTLDDGHVANLQFQKGSQEYGKFVNMVDNQVNINGIVNTVKGDAFYNGHAIFVSPNGIVVGASGVLNVGALTMATPDSDKYNAMKTAYDGGNLNPYEYDKEKYKELLSSSSGTITINGRVMSKGDVELYGKTIKVEGQEGNRAGIIAGVSGQTKQTDKEQAKQVFDSLVSNNISNANSFTLSGGKLKIVAQGKAGTTDSKDVSVTASVKKADLGAKEVIIEAKAEAVKEVTEDTIKEYNQNNNNQNNNNDKKDETTGYKIPDSFRGSAPLATATITIEDSAIRAEKISISAEAINKTKTYIQLLDPIWEKWIKVLGMDVLLRILNKVSDDQIIPEGSDIPWSSVEMVKQYFSDEAYSSMDGAHASAAVSLTNANLNAENSVEISSDAKATTDISTGKLDSHALFFYGLGAKTDSKVDISGSTIKTATGDEKEVSIAATSEIDNKIKYDSSKFLAITDKPQENNNNNNNNNDSNNNNNNNDSNNNNNNNNNGGQQSTVSAYNLVLLNNSLISDTKVTISDDSTIETSDFTAKAIGFNNSEVEVKNISNVGENSDKTGIAAALIINHTKTDSAVNIKDSTVNAEGDVKNLAQNINVMSNSVETEVQAKNQNYDIKAKELNTAGKTFTIKAYEWLNKKFLGKVTDKIGNVLDKADMEISGSAIWNNEHNTSTVAVDNSKVSGDNVNALSNMVDFAENSAEADAGAEKKISAGIGIIVNDQNNTNNAKIINGSEITAENNVNVNATTQLPMNPLGLTFGQEVGEGEKKVKMFVGVGFDNGGDSLTDWDADFLHTKVKDVFNWDNAKKLWNSIKNPRKFFGSNKIELEGLFNNKVKAEGSGNTANIAGSVLANSLTTKTSAFIDSATVTSENGKIVVNASNSIVNYNGAGKVEFLIDQINKFIGKLNPSGDDDDETVAKAGIGGSVLVDHFTNNATAYIQNSKVTAEKGDIAVKAASEEGYISMAVIGAKAGLFAVEGAVNVQKIDGKTEASIKNSNGENEIKAKNINVNAGKATISPKKSGEEDPIELDEDSGELSVNDERNVDDSVLNISLIGTNAQQEGSGVSVGAAIGVAKIAKEIVGSIEDSTVTASKDVNVTADTISRKIDVLGAAAFAGGVATSGEVQENINNDEAGAPNGQKMKNAGNWMDEMDAAGDDEEDVMNLRNLFDENDANSQAKPEFDNNKNAGTRNSGGSSGQLTGSSNTANTDTARDNFGIALAGAVNVTNDYTKTTAQIKDSTVKTGENLNVTADNDTLAVQINGSLSKSSTIAGGAGVNIYNNKSETKAIIDSSTVIKTATTNSGTDTPKIKVAATTDIDLIDVTAGISIASKSGFKASAGGAFGFNKLQNTVWAKIVNDSIIQKAENAADVNVEVNAKDDSYIWNIAGAAGIQSGGGANIGGGAAVTSNFTKKDIAAEINNSKLINVKDASVTADLDQDFNTVAVAGEISVGASSSYTVDGAVNVESNLNKVAAKAVNSEITSSGNVKIDADASVVNQSLAGSVDFSTAQSGFGVGIGSVVNVNDSTVKAEADNTKIHKSNAISINAQETENLKFLAANLGLQVGGAIAVNVNGIVNVFVSNVVADAINNSVLNSDGNVVIGANYDNLLRGITGTLDIAMASNVGSNLVGNGYNNKITAELQNGSEIKKAQNITVNAGAIEKMDLIPVGISASIGGNSIAAVAANISANVVKNTVEAKLNGKVSESNAVLVNAVDDTTIYIRGGTASGGLSTAQVAGSVNVDVVKKTVHAYVNGANVKTSGDMAVLASNINSMGGTKGTDGKYKTSDVTASGYKDTLLNKNDKGEYVGIKQDANFANWNMFYDASGGITGAGAGAVIIKTIGNEVEAKVLNSEIEADNLQVASNDYSIKNIIAGSIEGAGTAAIGIQVLVLNDDSTTTAVIGNNTKATIADTITLNAINRKDNQQIIIVGGGAGTVAANVNTFVNNIDDKATASINNADGANEISAQTIDINADETINASHIMVAGSGAGNVAISVAPLVNNYRGTTEASIKNAKIKDAAIDMDAENKLETLDISVGVAGAGQGLAGVGVAIKNNYTNTIKSFIDNAVINTANNIDIDANSTINSENWIASLSVAGQGASVIVNVLLNTVISTLEAGIKNSDIQKAGNIAINTNKNKKDRIYNRVIGLGIAGQGASALANVVQNIYTNTVKSYVENTSSTEINSLDIEANSNRRLDNVNYGLSVTGQGVSLLANALVNQIDSTTRAYVDAQSKKLNVTNALTVHANDKNEADNSMAMINGAGIGAAAGANINLYYADNTAKAEVLSGSNGQINAGSSDVKAVMTNGLDNLNAAVSLGFGAIAGDVALIRLGKRTDNYSDEEKGSKIVEAVNYTKDKYDKITANDTIKGKYTPTSSSSVKTGAIASVNGNLKTSNDTEINASSQLKGLGSKEKLELTNTNVSVGIATVGVGVKNTQLTNNTIAEISGGRVESTSGDISVKANSKSDVEIKNVKVDVSGVSVSGGSAIYNNASQTIAQIENATVNTNNLDVVSKSVSNSNLDSTNVVVTGGGIVSVDLSEAKDTNKSVAMITGNTNIDASGKLTVHSTANTDLSSTKATVTVSGASIVGISKNEANAATINQAIIKNVNGTIKANDLDIITDYDKMSVLSKANVTSVKLGDVYSGDTSGAFMNANFKTGIDSASGLILNNTGTTNIIAARDNGTDGILAKGEIHNVHVSLQGFVANTSAKAENTATAATMLKAKEHNAQSLNINSYLNSKATANAGATKATVGIGVNVVNVDAKDTSNMTVDIAGKNTITGTATINTNHHSQVNSDMSAFNFGGLVGGGQRIRINSNLSANTTGNIGGEFNVNKANINFNTVRDSIMSKSSGSGSGIINVSDTGASNNLSGSSVLTISGLSTSKETGNNQWAVKNASTNTMDVTSSDSSGGIINVSANNMTSTFTSSTTTKVINSEISSNNTVGFTNENTTVVKDTASMGAGGVVSLTYNTVNNTYTSESELTVENSKISAKDINLTSKTDIHNAKGSIVDYAGAGGGFIAKNALELTNTLNQINTIDIKNSQLHAGNDIEINLLNAANFGQKTDSTVGGFVAVPRSKNWLNVNNTNTINIDAASNLLAADEFEINFNSNASLEARATSKASHFGFKDPVSESYLTYIIKNTINNNGMMEAGNLVDINFMTDSTNNLTQYAYSEARAAIPTTTEDGKLTKTIQNTLNVTTGASIKSGKDIDISFSSGRGSNSSTIAYETVCYALFGIPISKSGSKSNTSISHSPNLALNGDIIAGQGNSKYMKINRDGTIDKSTLEGFYDDDYTISNDGIIDAQSMKDQSLASIQLEVENIDETLGEVTQTLSDLNTTITQLNTVKTIVTQVSDELQGLIDSGYTMVNSETEDLGNNQYKNDFNDLINGSLKSLVVTTDTSAEPAKIPEALFNTILSDYSAELEAITAYNEDPANADNPRNYPDINEFIDNGNYGLTADQKTTFNNGYTTINSKITYTSLAGFTIFDGQYVAVSNPTATGGCDELTEIAEELSNIDKLIQSYQEVYDANTSNKAVLEGKKNELLTTYNETLNADAVDYNQVESDYSIVFNDITPKVAHINIDGAFNPHITGNGKFKVANNGLRIDNYSTRSLVFNDLDIDSAANPSGLIIGGKEHSQFADKDQAVSGMSAYNYIYRSEGSFDNLPTNGAHYIHNGNSLVGSGITINNYYDINHPFASTFTDVPFPTTESDIYFLGDIETSGDWNVLNESGKIGIAIIDTVVKDAQGNPTGEIVNNNINVNKTSLIATNDIIAMFIHDESASPETYHIKAGDYIFARDEFTIMSNRDVDVKGTIKTGYSNRNITITNDMIASDNLIVDPTSGEKNMINLGGTNVSPYMNDVNNIKAIYKDGQIYLYNIPEILAENGVNFHSKTVTLGDGANITVADGYQSITIDNQTSAQLNVNEIINAKFTATLPDGVAESYADKIHKNTLNNASTNIKSVGKLALNGVIKNNVDSKPSYETLDGGTLNITAKNGLELKKHTKIVGETTTTIDSILAGGLVDITVDDGEALIYGNITDKGNVNIYKYGNGKIDILGDITDKEGDINIQNDGAGKLTVKGKIADLKGDISILGTGTGATELTNEISAELGDITVVSKGLTTTEDSVITDKKGDISITNNAENLDLKGTITAEEGNLSIQNNGASANIAANLSDEKGDLTIINTNGDMTISSIIYHNYVNPDAAGMIAIINNPNGGLLDIKTPIQTWGIGKTEDGKTTAILIDNRSTTTGMTINKLVTARVGDIIIRNAAKDLTITSSVSNTEQGNIEIYNTGKDLQTTSNIVNTKGDTIIANTGTGKTLFNGSISNNDGNTSISGGGSAMEINGTVNNTGGNTSVTNTAGSLGIAGNITNKGGNITVNNTGSMAQITSVVKNEGGSIQISNSNGDLNIGDTAQILNNSNNAEHSITIVNSGDKLQISGTVESANKGNISITNTGGSATLANRISAKEGDISISNSNAGALKITGDVVDDKGNVSITNNSADGAEIGGTITDEQGDITITNNGGDLNITSEIKHNYTNNDAQGMIAIVNGTSAGAVNIDTAIATYGEGKTEGEKTTAILIDNRSTTKGMTLKNSISARKGDIIINNAAQKLDASADISNTEEGGISITNNGGDTEVSGDITAHKGNVEVTNNNAGDLTINGDITTETVGDVSVKNNGEKLTVSSDITTKEGDIDIINEGSDATLIEGNVTATTGDITVANNAKTLEVSGDISTTTGDVDIKNNSTDSGTTISGDVSTDEGNVSIENNGDKLAVSGDITDTKGNIEIANNGTGGAEISQKVLAKEGNITVTNTAGTLSLTATSDVTDDKGDISISNTAADKGTNLAGKVLAKEGDISVENNGDKLAVSGQISDDNGKIDITNNGSNGMEFASSAKVTNDKANTTITNNKGNLTVAEGAEIKNTESGNIEIENKDGLFSVAGTVTHTGTGDIELKNSGSESFELASTGAVAAKKGDISIINTAAKGANIAGTITDEEGNTLIDNQNGLVYTASLENSGGNTTITNTGDAEMSGSVSNSGGNTSIANTEGALNLASTVNNAGGNLSVTNTGNGTTISGDLDNTGGDVVIENNGKDLVLTAGSTVDNNDAGNVAISNSGDGKLAMSGAVNNKVSGDTTITNTGANGAEIAGNIGNVGGNTTIDNKNGLTYTASLENSGGNTTIANTGDAEMSSSVSNSGGNTSISNTDGALNLASTVNNAGGNLSVTNTGNGTTISGDLDNSGGNVVIENTGKDLVLTADSTVDNNEAGNVAITNSGDGKLAMSGAVNNKVSGDTTITNTGDNGAEIAGNIGNVGGNTTIDNKNGLTYTASLENSGGDTTITNTGDAEMSGSVINSGGNTSISNTGGALNLASTVNNAGGNLSVTNTGNGTTISGDLDNAGGNVVIENTGKDLVLTADSTVDNNDAGNVAISNSGDGKLAMSGAVNNKVSGDTTITNTGANGAEIAGNIGNVGGNTTIDNQNGLVYTAALNNEGGNTTITNTGDAEMSGSVSNSGGNTSIANTNGALSLASTVNNAGGNLSVTNTGNGTTISGDLDNSGGNVAIENNGKDLVLTADSTVDNNEAGDVAITNSGDGKLAMSGSVNNKVSGDTTITNTGANGAKIAGKVTNTQGDLTVQNQKSDLVFAQGSVLQNHTSGNIKVENTEQAAALTVAGAVDNSGNGNIVADNRGAGEFTVTPSGNIHAADGDINLTNTNDGGLEIAGQVVADNGKTTIDNTSKDGMKVATTGQIIGKTGDIEINNSGEAGIKIEGKVLAQKQNIAINNRYSDLVIGELDSANDNYVEATAGNVVIKQANGDVLNGIVDTANTHHQNADLGNPQQSYKTLIVAGNDLDINVTDGNIGYTDNANPGFSIDAATRDWTDSVNIKVGGDITAIAANDNNSDARLINLRAKDSGMNVKNVTADGNVMLTAADWKQADVRPTPDDEAYFKGYSIFNTADGHNAAVTAQNISVIASDNIGSKDHKFIYRQDTATNPNSSVSFEAENDLRITGSANSENETKLYQLISKHGTLDLDLESNASIGYITAGEGLEITQKAQNLTIGEIGLSSDKHSAQADFDDILYAHDGLVYGDSGDSSGSSVVPKYVIIRALDAMDNSERADSNLKIYSLTVRGNNGDNDNYYPDGGRLADVTLMADNIYANSDKAPDSNVSTKANPDGYKQTETTYNDAIFGGTGVIRNARGINAYGEGTPLSLDVLGVDKDVVANMVENPQRNEYAEQTSLQDIPSKFRNSEDSIYDYDFRAKNAVISVNDYSDGNRGVEFDTLYADNAYINTLDTNLTVHDGYVKNYAELRNGNHDTNSNRYLVVVDNDYRRLVPSNVQLYTQKTGSFALAMSDLVKFNSPAPVVHYDWDKLVNTFSDENSFVRLGLKETELRQKAKDYYAYGNTYIMPETPTLMYEAWRDGALVSDVKIMEISRYGATIVNRDNWQVGEEHEIALAIDGTKANVKCVVTKVESNLATVKFVELPAAIANKIAYRQMKTAQK